MPTIEEAIVAYLAGEADATESRRVADWRASDLANEREFQRLFQLWTGIGDLDWNADGVPMPAAREIVELAESRSRSSGVRSIAAIPPQERERPVRRRRRAKIRFLREAAVAAALVIGIGLGGVLMRPGSEAEGPYGREQILTGPGEFATTTLVDGTVVRIGPESRIEFPRGGYSREVSLEGQAFFAVSKADEPFRIHTSGGEVEVLGTRFELESRNRSVEVTVLEGQVKLHGQGGQAEVGPNQIARSNDAGPPEVEDVDDVFESMEWLGDFLAFESTPMTDVVDEFQRRFDMRVEIADTAIFAMQVTGWFANGSPEDMIAGICTAIDARCTVQDGQVLIERRSSGTSANP
ncbi:MAG: FecR domain-containing protein [Gemmatimonadota bacterium]